MFSLKQEILKRAAPSKANFYEFMSDMDEYFYGEGNAIKDSKYYELNERALIGDPEAVAYFYHEIDKYLRTHPFRGIIPDAYSSTVEGLFHEWKGFGSAYQWLTKKRFNNSSGLQIIGQNIFYNHKGRFIDYGHRLRSLDRVEQLKRTLLSADERARANRDNPAEEFKLNDPLWPGRFIRIAMWVYPRTWEEFPTISMRRQIVEYLNFEDQVGTGSIPNESLPLWHALNQMNENMICAGPVGSGKTTFANSFVGEQMKKSTDKALGVIMIERHPESILPYVIQGHRIIPVMARHEELMEVGIESLRMDPDVVFMTEMRHNEWEFYIWAGSKGYDNIIGTFHTDDAEDIPYQGALAVYSIIGGSLKGHLMSALQSCRIVAIMNKLPNGEKRVTRLSEIVYDEINREVYANDLMRWNETTNEWSYNDEVSEAMRERMKEKKVFDTFMQNLSKLAKVRRIRDPRVISKRSRMVLHE